MPSKPSLRHSIAWRAVVGGYACGIVAPLLIAPAALGGSSFSSPDPTWAAFAHFGRGVFVVGLVSSVVGLIVAVNARVRLLALPPALGYLSFAGFFVWLSRSG